MTDVAKTEPETQELTFSLDGRTVTARHGELLIAAAERAGTYIRAFATTRAWTRSACAACAWSTSRARAVRR